MICQVHEVERCPAAKCQVVAMCAAQVPALPIALAAIPPAIDGFIVVVVEWGRKHGYYTADNLDPIYPGDDLGEWRAELAALIADRLLAWVRWPGVCDMCDDSTGRDNVCGTDMDPADCHRVHPLDELDITHEDRVRITTVACPNKTCAPINPGRGRRWHWRIVSTSQGPAHEPAPCEHDGANWAGLLVIGDILAGGKDGVIRWDLVHAWHRRPGHDLALDG